MDSPLPMGDITFDVIHHDGWIRVCITDGEATFHVDSIWDDQIVRLALKKALSLGATHGRLYSYEVVNDHLAEKHRRRAEKGITWLGGTVTQLEDREGFPQFRIDWQVLPEITE